jgi:hypothetical protein
MSHRYTSRHGALGHTCHGVFCRHTVTHSGTVTWSHCPLVSESLCHGTVTPSHCLSCHTVAHLDHPTSHPIAASFIVPLSHSHIPYPNSIFTMVHPSLHQFPRSSQTPGPAGARPGLAHTSHSELSPSSGLLHHHHGIQCYALVALQVQAQLREGIVLRIAVTYYITSTCHTCYITLLPKGFIPMLFLAYLVQYWAF